MPHNDPKQRSSAVSVFAAIACVVLAFILLLVGVVVGVLFMVQRAVNQELADLGAAISELDRSYAESQGELYDDGSASMHISAVALTQAFASDFEQAGERYAEYRLQIDGEILALDAHESTLTLAGAETDGLGQLKVQVLLPVEEFNFAVNTRGLSTGETARVRGFVTSYDNGVVFVRNGMTVDD